MGELEDLNTPFEPLAIETDADADVEILLDHKLHQFKDFRIFMVFIALALVVIFYLFEGPIETLTSSATLVPLANNKEAYIATVEFNRISAYGEKKLFLFFDSILEARQFNVKVDADITLTQMALNKSDTLLWSWNGTLDVSPFNWSTQSLSIFQDKGSYDRLKVNVKVAPHEMKLVKVVCNLEMPNDRFVAGMTMFSVVVVIGCLAAIIKALQRQPKIPGRLTSLLFLFIGFYAGSLLVNSYLGIPLHKVGYCLLFGYGAFYIIGLLGYFVREGSEGLFRSLGVGISVGFLVSVILWIGDGRLNIELCLIAVYDLIFTVWDLICQKRREEAGSERIKNYSILSFGVLGILSSLCALETFTGLLSRNSIAELVPFCTLIFFASLFHHYTRELTEMEKRVTSANVNGIGIEDEPNPIGVDPDDEIIGIEENV